MHTATYPVGGGGVGIMRIHNAPCAAAVATSWPPLISLPRLGAGGLFPHPPKAMSLLTSKAATEVAAEEEEEEEDGEGEAGRKILKLVLDGGGTNITAKCLGPFRDRIIVGEVVKRQYVFECGWGRWRPLQTSGQGCGQVRKSPWFPYPYTSPIEFYLVLLKYIYMYHTLK